MGPGYAKVGLQWLRSATMVLGSTVFPFPNLSCVPFTSLLLESLDQITQNTLQSLPLTHR